MMANIGLIFTTDYEIFGNGSGSVEQCMIAPAEAMATALEEYGARLTLFVDVCEYWAFEQEYKKGNLKQDWAGMIRKQLRDLAQRGHDVQLHFHPQWLDYTFDGHTWHLNYDLWRIGRLKYEDTTHPERSLKTLFARGKSTLEEIIRPVVKDYRCHIFRAGAWSMQPEGAVLKAMRKNGFDMDSTVAPGLAFNDDYTFYDFAAAPTQPYWKIEDELCQISPTGSITEVPIFTTKMPLLKKINFLALKRKRAIPMKPDGCTGSSLATAGKSKWAKARELLLEKRKMFTFGDATTCEEMIYFARQAQREAVKTNSGQIPVVAISHPKTFANEQELRGFLKWASQKSNNIVFTNYNTFIK